MSRAGRKAFDRCDVKEVEFVNFVFDGSVKGSDIVNDDGLVDTGDKTSKRVQVTPKNQVELSNNWDAGSQAILRCPMTEGRYDDITSDANNHETRLEALKSVREIAAELLCRNCRFSGMTPVEVSVERAQLARTEAERTEALAALERARNDLYAVAPHLELPKPE